MLIERPASKQPLPAEAKLVFKGVVFDVYQWEQTMFDGTIATFEKLRRDDTAVVIPVLPDGSILLVEEEQPLKAASIHIPSGRIESGEDALSGAKRELLEETGHESDSWKLWFAYQPASKIDWAVYIFVAQNCRKTSDQSLDPGERIALRPFSFEDFINWAVKAQLLEGDPLLQAFEAKYSPEAMRRLREFLTR